MSVVAKRMEADLRAAQRHEFAEALVGQLLSETEQMQLFDPDPFSWIAASFEDDVRAANPDKLVIKGGLVDEYRCLAAMRGAGFHPSQYEDVMLDVGEEETYVSVGLLGMVHIEHTKRKMPRSNRIRDEVIFNEPFISIVPTTDYHKVAKVYITSEEDLLQVFKFDQENLEACKILDPHGFMDDEFRERTM